MKKNLVLALAAGLVGGALSHYLFPGVVRAEGAGYAPPELRARSFLVVDDRGHVVGKFTADASGRPAIRLLDMSGHEIWSAEPPPAHGAVGR